MGTIKISGGRSFKNGVAFATNRYIATAKLDDSGISCDVRKLPDSVLGWQKFNERFKLTPRLLIVLVSAWIGTEKLRNKLLFVSILAGLCYALSFHVNNQLFAGAIAGMLVAGAILLMEMNAKIKPFHAAEHMAFNAYMNFSSTELEVIKAQSRYHEICGTSVIMTFILVLALAPFLALSSHLSFVVSLALLMETLLWVDRLVGWHKLPIFRGLNKWLQLHYTTSEPDVRQLEVAKAALEAVIAAHSS